MKIDRPRISIPQIRLPGWKSTIAAIFCIWLFGLTSFHAAFDAIFYDFFSRYIPTQPASASKVVLIEADYDKRDAFGDALGALTKKSLTSGAAQVLFLFTPASSPEFMAWAKANKNILFSTPISQNQKLTQNLSHITSKNKEGVTVAHIPSPYHGLFNIQQNSYQFDSLQLPTIEAVAAKQLGKPVSLDHHFWVNFSGGLASLPRLQIDDALKGNIVPELVSGRSVVVGLSGGNAHLGLNFPGGEGAEVATPNEFHAFALNTLLTDQEIKPLSSFTQLLVLSLFAVFVFVVYQPVPLRHMLRLSLGLFLVYGALCWGALSFFNIWIPFASILLLHMATLAFVYRGKGRIENQRLERILVESSAKLHDRVLPASFTDTQEHWSYAITMVEQILSLNRIIFLERIPGDHRVREIKSLNCDVGDIDEKRRDYERTPYTTALQQQSPLEVKNYLKNIDATEERQFLVPLVFEGEVYGFWAFGILTNRLADEPNFMARVEELSEQLGLLLYQRKIHQDRTLGEKRDWQQLLADRQSDALKKLRSAITLEDQRMESLEYIFRDLSTAAILYDFFGRVVLVNDQMHTLLRFGNLNPYQMTAVDLIALLTKKDLESIRNLVQFTVFDGQRMSLPATIGEPDARKCLLSFRAIGKETLSNAINTNSNEPFHSKGLLVELVDISEISRIQATKLRLIDRLKYLLHNDIAALLAASSLLKTENLDADSKQLILHTMDAKISSATDGLNKTLSFLSDEDFIKTTELYPMDVLAAIKKAASDTQISANLRRIKIETSLPNLTKFAMASQQEIGNTLKTILDYLLEDTVEDGVIKISMEETEHQLHIVFENTGMGIPQEKINAYLFGKEEVTSKTFRYLRTSIGHIQSWGGTLQATSHVGEGIRFTLTLRTFM